MTHNRTVLFISFCLVSLFLSPISQAQILNCEIALNETSKIRIPLTAKLTLPFAVTSAGPDVFYTIPASVMDVPDYQKLKDFADQLGDREIAIFETGVVNGWIAAAKGELFFVDEVYRRGSDSLIKKKLADWGFIPRRSTRSTSKPFDIQDKPSRRDILDLFGAAVSHIFLMGGGGEPLKLTILPVHAIYRLFRRPSFDGWIMELTADEYTKVAAHLKSGEPFQFNPELEAPLQKLKAVLVGSSLGAWFDWSVMGPITVAALLLLV
jgi:hypothetical protein